MGYLIFLFISIILIWLILFPFLIRFDIRFNLLKLKGSIAIIIFNKIKIEYKIRIKNGYVYINHKNKSRKEKISNKNINFVFILNFFNQLYFREQFLNFNLKSNFGYVLNSCTTAVVCGTIEVITKSFLCKLKNNKKSSHIFVKVEPQYNQDIFNARLDNSIRISLADILYSLIYTIIKTWSSYEKSRQS